MVGGNNSSQRKKREKDRLNTVFRKAEELSVYTDSKVAVVINSPNGKHYEYASSNTSMPEIMERYERDMERQVQARMPIQHPEAQADHEPIAAENMQRPETRTQSDESMTNENVQQSTQLFGLSVSESDKKKIVDTYTAEEIEEYEQLLKQTVNSLQDRKVGIKSSSGSKESKEAQLIPGVIESIGIESLPRHGSNGSEFYAREAQTMEVDTELCLGFPQWRA